MNWRKLFVFQLICLIFGRCCHALNEDQIYHHDWQSISIGLPIDSLRIDDQLITLAESGVLSLINATTGDVLYRFNNEYNAKLSTDSGLVVNDNRDIVLSYFNFEQEVDSIKSKFFAWNLEESSLELIFETKSPYKILSTFSKDQIIYIVDERRLLKVIDRSVDVLYEIDEGKFENALFVNNHLAGELFVFLETNNTVLFSNIESIQLNHFPHCRLNSVRYLEKEGRNLLIYENTEIYQFDNNNIAKLRSFTEPVIDDRLPISGLISSPVESFEVVDTDHVIISSQNEMNLFGYNALSFTPNVKFSVPETFEHATHHLFYVPSNMTVELFLVTIDKVLEYYINGELQWSSDQSFSDILDFAIMDMKPASPLTIDELVYETNFNIFWSYIRRVKHNYNTLFKGGGKASNVEQQFGFEKRLIVLSENGKIGVFNMYRKDNSAHQLNSVFKLTAQLVKLSLIDDTLYGLTDDFELFKIDIEKGYLSRMPGTFFDSHFKRTKFGRNETEILQTDRNEFYTNSFSREMNLVQGHYMKNGTQIDTWKYNSIGEILSLTKRTYSNDEVAQTGIILPDRSTLYKYLVPNVGIITSYYEGEITLDLVDMITGQSYGRFTKFTGPNIDIENELFIRFEENFIILSIPDGKNPFDAQICAIDLFESLVPDEKASKNIVNFSNFDDSILPSFATQCYILPNTRVKDLAISSSKHNIANKAIIIRTSFGRVLSIPKMVLDGRRNGNIGDFSKIKLDSSSLNDSKFSTSIYTSKYAKSIANALLYDPLININPQLILSHSRQLINNYNGNKVSILETIPTELESMSYVLSIDGDIFVTFIRPSGSFDRLTASFNTPLLVTTILILVLGIVYIRPKLETKKLSTLWTL